MKEQISESFADKLLNKNIWNLSIKEKNRIKKLWKESGYIKQSREEEIRQKLETIINWEHRCYLMEELIEILDNKDKQC